MSMSMRPQFRLIVAGSRSVCTEAQYSRLREKLDHLLSARADTHDICIVSGTARGADKLGERYAQERGYVVHSFPADWTTHGKKAGFLRNVEMAQNADALLAAWDGQSRGTQHMIDIAKRRQLPIRILHFSEQT